MEKNKKKVTLALFLFIIGLMKIYDMFKVNIIMCYIESILVSVSLFLGMWIILDEVEKK